MGRDHNGIETRDSPKDKAHGQQSRLRKQGNRAVINNVATLAALLDFYRVFTPKIYQIERHELMTYKFL